MAAEQAAMQKMEAGSEEHRVAAQSYAETMKEKLFNVLA